MLFSKKKKGDCESKNEKNKVLDMKYKTIKYEIDDLTYLMIDNIVKEKVVASGKILDTNQAIEMIIERAFNQFILNHQEFLYENFNRRNSILDKKMEGREIKFEEIFGNININQITEENE